MAMGVQLDFLSGARVRVEPLQCERREVDQASGTAVMTHFCEADTSP